MRPPIGTLLRYPRTGHMQRRGEGERGRSWPTLPDRTLRRRSHFAAAAVPFPQVIAVVPAMNHVVIVVVVALGVRESRERERRRADRERGRQLSLLRLPRCPQPTPAAS